MIFSYCSAGTKHHLFCITSVDSAAEAQKAPGPGKYMGHEAGSQRSGRWCFYLVLAPGLEAEWWQQVCQEGPHAPAISHNLGFTAGPEPL